MLEKIGRSEDVKKLNIEELSELCSDIRKRIVEVTTKNGGHLASNLGAVELTVALHYVFDFPLDKIVFDVGHQCYTHKILSGRKDTFDTIRLPGGLSGFPRRAESEFDAFDTGHASTALSAALGLAKARDLRGERHQVIALLGDGALSGGLAYEALNNVANIDTKVIAVLNDNGMSISRTVGGLSKRLSKVRVSLRYTRLKKGTKKFFGSIPLVGRATVRFLEGTKDLFSRMLVRKIEMFEQMGFKYIGPIDGNSVEDLVAFLKKIKDYDRSVLLHVRTKKGKGYEQYESAPEMYHGVLPEENFASREYSEILGEELVGMAGRNPSVAAITAAMGDATGLASFREKFPDRYFDVGIAEAHACTMAAGLAVGGMKPYVAIYSTFLQRAYDQILHDVCLQKLPVTFCIDRAGLALSDGETHQGLFDLSYLGMIPNLTVAVPRDGNEFLAMLEWSESFFAPLAVRYPRSMKRFFGKTAPIERGKWEVLRHSDGGAVILACGENMIALAEELAEEVGNVAVVNARFVKPLDEEMLLSFSDRPIVTLEENVLAGGFGSSVCAFYAKKGIRADVSPFGIDDRFVPQGERESVLSEYGINRAKIAALLAEKGAAR